MSTPSGFPAGPPPPPPPGDIVAPSFSFYEATRTVGRLMTVVTVGLFSIVVQTSSFVARAAVWLFGAVVSIATWPVVRLFQLLRFLFSPVTYTLSYVFAPVVPFLSFLSRLRPLYTYLGSAAFIGIVTGLVLKFASGYFFVMLSLDDRPKADDGKEEDDEEDIIREAPQQRQLEQKRRSIRELHDKAKATLALPKSEPSNPDGEINIKTEDSITPQDDVWQWLEEYNPNQPVVAIEANDRDSEAAVALLRRQSPGPGGLLSQTIMEESSSE